MSRPEQPPKASAVASTSAKAYACEDPPPHPGDTWTRFVCISDTHSRKFPIPPGDVLLHAGDLSSRGTLAKLKVTIEWLMTLPHPTKIIIAGNHDLCLDENWSHGDERVPSHEIIAARTLLHSQAVQDSGIIYLQYEACTFKTTSGKEWNVFGFPGSPLYAGGAFQYPDSEADKICACIPHDTAILLTHTPPYGILDTTRKGKHAGCKALKAQMNTLEACRLHVFGHIHEQHGVQIAPEDGTVSVNAALYLGGGAVIVDLKN
ncbi:hypothetical protein PLICRDRAFT_40565 [Plicaturopsis crispa FD-325 SS-3]|nr:hypothetical protein PLICRDRAFT_40565 [Plicaturopsis crispa FD-325 SS-3]